MNTTELMRNLMLFVNKYKKCFEIYSKNEKVSSPNMLLLHEFLCKYLYCLSNNQLAEVLGKSRASAWT